METWAEAKQINNDSEMRARIGGVAKQMESFDVFFGLELGRIVFSMSDNLSKVLQGSSISASEGQSLMKMTLVAFQAIRSEDSFSVFWKTIERKRQLCKAVLIADPSLPRQRKVPKHLEIGSSWKMFIERLIMKSLILLCNQSKIGSIIMVIKCYRNWKSCCVIRNVSWRIIVM